MIRKNLKIFILVILMIFFYYIQVGYNDKDNPEKDFISKTDEEINNLDKIQSPVVSTYWNLEDFHLIVNDTDLNHNWLKINNTYKWCSGKGTFKEPFVIENVSIDGSESGIGIHIINSNNSYFCIKNSKIFNATTGIKMYNTSRGTLLNNSCSKNSQYGIYLDTCQNNTLLRNNASQNGIDGSSNVFGIYISNSNNNTLEANNVSSNLAQNMCFGIYLKNSNYNNLSLNSANSNKANICVGLRLENSNSTLIIENFAYFNDFTGISFGNCKNCCFRNNKIIKGGFFFENPPFHLNSLDESNLVNRKPLYYQINKRNLSNMNYTDPGQIFLYNCNDSTVFNIDIFNSSNGLWIEESNNISISYSNFSYDIYSGMFVRYCSNISVSDNHFRNNSKYGIYFWEGSNHTISNNIFKYNLNYGIYGFSSENNTILRNTFNSNGQALSVSGINYTIHSNIAYKNGASLMVFCDNCSIYNNTVSESGSIGFNFYGDYSVLKNNTASNNEGDGFYIRYNDNEISNNKIINNKNGIYIHGDSNIISKNTLQSNNKYGIISDSYSSDNKIYDNSFIKNDINALDNGTGNTWNDAIIGNFWDDYDGKDYDDNGIGDAVYIIGGIADAKDNYPRFDDGPDPPSLKLITPISEGLFGDDPPNFIIEINDASLSTSWYVISDGIYTSPKCIFKNNGSIIETEWNKLLDGALTLMFNANDTLGNENFITIEIFKDSTAPTIIVSAPSTNGTFGREAPAFNVMITDANLHTCWYSISGWNKNFTFTENGTFNQKAWESIWDITNDGKMIIVSFYANDSLKNINFITLSLKKTDLIKYNDIFFIIVFSWLIITLFCMISSFWALEHFLSRSELMKIKKGFNMKIIINQIKLMGGFYQFLKQNMPKLTELYLEKIKYESMERK